MNPKTISDTRPVVWTISVDPEARKVERNYCLYNNGQLYRENMDIDEFLATYYAMRKLYERAGLPSQH